MPLKFNSDIKVTLGELAGYFDSQGDSYLDTTIPLEYSYDLLFFKLTCYIEDKSKNIVRSIIGSDIKINGEVLYSTLERLIEHDGLNEAMSIAKEFHGKRNKLAHEFSYLPSEDIEFQKYIDSISSSIQPIESIKDQKINKLVRAAEAVIHHLRNIEFLIHQKEALAYVCPIKKWEEVNLDDFNISEI